MKRQEWRLGTVPCLRADVVCLARAGCMLLPRMIIPTLILAGSLTVLAQGSSDLPYRVGPTAANLTGDDVAQISRLVAETGSRPWVVVGRQVGLRPPPAPWFVDVYLAPDLSTGAVRRGRAMRLRAQLPRMGDFTAHRVWSLDSYFDWAQVPELGRDADEVTGSRDVNRPFPVAGVVSDAALMGALAAIRLSPPMPVPAGVRPGQMVSEVLLRVHGSWPVAHVSGREDGGVDVWLRTNPQESGGQIVRAHLREGRWHLVIAGAYTHGE
jgi:hypothetical protein